MQGLHKRVLIALAMAWTASSAAQFEPQKQYEPNLSTAEGRQFPNRSTKLDQRADYLKPVKYHVPGAKFVKLRFSDFNLPPGMAIEISNPDGSETWRYTKDERDPFTINPEFGDDGDRSFSAMSVTGDTAIVRFSGFTSQFDPVFHSVAIEPWTDQVLENTTRDKKKSAYSDSGIETTCGQSERYDAICWAGSHSDEYERSTPVALVITATGKKCTAWRVGRHNRLFTARHCISSRSTLEGAEIWFNYEATVCGGLENTQVVKVTGDELLASDYHLDYTLFSVKDFNKISSFGNLGLDLRDGRLGEDIFIPQHGNGNPKQIAIESDMNVSGKCEIDDNDVDGFIEGSDIGYMCDTVSSSSGSPVISAVTGKAIALHHNGGCFNTGTKVSKIWPEVADFFYGVVPKGNSDGNWAEGNQPPKARFQQNCSGLDCQFDASTSEDSDGSIKSFKWSLGESNEAEGSIVEHTFSRSGDYEIELMVLDDEGASDTTNQTISVSLPNEKPLAKFSTQCVGNVCKFNAGSSSDTDGSIVSWTWAMGDGSHSSGKVVEHTYQQEGDYTVDLTVEDDDQATDQSSFTVSVQIPNEAPTARFDIDCQELECQANASGSFDTDGEIVEYQWSLGNGSEASGQSPRFMYETAGTYSVNLTVVDNNGATGSIEQSVSVETKNAPPTAAFTGSCEQNVCTFDASESSDSDGNISIYEWTLTSRLRHYGRTVEYTFDEEGSRTVRLRVTDDRGAEDAAEKTFNITLPKEPVARFTVSCEDLECTLDAGSSIASDGAITQYDWSFGDGHTASGGNVNHEYQEDGRYTVTLKITDSTKANTTTSQTIEVTAKGKIQLQTSVITKPKRPQVSLNWSGTSSARIEIYRNNQHLASVYNTTTYADQNLKNLTGLISYRVCEAETGLCSNVDKLRLVDG